MGHELQIFAINGIGEIRLAADLAGIIATAATVNHGGLRDGDVLVVTQKVVSKAENQLVAIDPDDPLEPQGASGSGNGPGAYADVATW